MSQNGLTIVRIDSHIDDVDKVISTRIKKALEMMGEVVEGYAKEDCPVDTGRLRNSITHENRDANTEYVGSNVEYAPYVEFIDSNHHPVGKAHFLRDGGADHIDELRKVAEAVLSSDIY